MSESTTVPATRLEPASRWAGFLGSVGRAVRPASFGADPTGERLERVLRSPNFRDGSFRNSEPARMIVQKGMVREYFLGAGRRQRYPGTPIQVYADTAADLATPSDTGLRTTWMGHATVFVEIDGHRVLFDPVWGKRCSPFTFAGPGRFHPVPVALDALDPDVVVISHDHYDHLDMPSIRALVSSRAVFAVPLGVGAHLEYWGVPAGRIVELDWDESAEVAGLGLTATPARHFCGRGIRNGTHTLWASWAVAGPEHRVFHSGDTGYFAGFATIGAQHGPFDLTMIQIGAYSEFWPDIHMTPEEGVQAHADLAGAALLPIHWGTFNLALHPWNEPADRTLASARQAGARVAIPRPGQPFEPTLAAPTAAWWR
ncbi:MBL fold metallo-hydrolase [Longispora fulva]|uniref:L-ascorbate metabolism protein UlaG (Beta-lactamase superfamily) n=2 Tax=Longispora fulva TaxID=619741 RepID=A0A8J7GUX8_9ACTN|nr:MBL fold metallo-hydrolase [Longispora fulva]MBG6138628.1 L-ascorbate metabolism protein UlaG (beta-lactamase superfamily) [Longispora fulva]GIG62265.1 MBL fold metallo-hydrolase [Longispora fulva]